jgi:hypothetical protein
VNAWTGLGDTNSTLNILPGGLLAQNIAGVATNGRSNQEMNRFVPDPKKAAIGGLISAVKNPSSIPNSTLSGAMSFGGMVATTTKPSFAEILSRAPISTPTHTLQILQSVATAPKPSILNHFGPPSMAMSMPFKKSTISSENASSSYEEGTQEKMSIMESMMAPDPDSNPRPPPVSTLGNEQLQRAVGTPDTFASPSSSMNMIPFVALACVLVLVVMR